MGKTILRSPIFTAVLFVVAAVLLVGGTMGAVQAAPRTQSNDFNAQVQLSSVDTAVVENGSVVEGDALLKNLIGKDPSFKIGKEYDEALAVQNVGSTDQYVRATVLRYWTDGKKRVDLDPSLIKLHFVESGGWSIDQDASTDERTVLYYSSMLAAGGTSPVFVDKLSIDPKVLKSATESAGDVEYDYEGLEFHVEVTADAVQTHNADAAKTSAWGKTN